MWILNNEYIFGKPLAIWNWLRKNRQENSEKPQDEDHWLTDDKPQNITAEEVYVQTSNHLY